MGGHMERTLLCPTREDGQRAGICFIFYRVRRWNKGAASALKAADSRKGALDEY